MFVACGHKVRRVQPSIACTTEDGQKCYQTATDQKMLDQWLDETVIVIEGETSSEVFPKLSSRLIEKSTLFVLLATNEIIIRITHENADAEGIICVLDLLDQNLANPAGGSYPFDGSEVSKLSQPFALGASLPTTTTEEGISLASKALSNYASNLPGLGLPAKNMDELPGDAHRYDTALSIEESISIVRASRGKGLTPFQVFQTTAMMVTYKMCVDKSRRYSTFGIFGLRKHCSEPVKSDTTSISIIGWPVVYAPPYDSFYDLSGCIKSF